MRAGFVLPDISSNSILCKRSTAILRKDAQFEKPFRITTTYGVSTPFIYKDRSATTIYFHIGFKNAESQTIANETVSATQTFDAFGLPDTSSGSWKGPFGYGGLHGYQSDADSGLMLLGHRYYDSSTGRFLTRDPAKDGRNWYVYCENNSTSRVDPNGQEWHDPTRVHVDPHFSGKVWAMGETEPGGPMVIVEVRPGQTTHPGMDVDYVIIVMPDGTKYTYFLPGVLKGTGVLGTAQYTVRPGGGFSPPVKGPAITSGTNGFNIAPAPIPIDGPTYWPWPWPVKDWIDQAKKRPFPPNKRPLGPGPFAGGGAGGGGGGARPSLRPPGSGSTGGGGIW